MATAPTQRNDLARQPTTQMDTAMMPSDRVSGEALVTAGVGDTCSNCGAPLAPDQRYCVECGERRGKPRFTASALAGTATPREATSLAAHRRRFSLSSNGALLAGIAVLLLAMGVGVLIGQSGNNGTSKGAPLTVVNGGGGSAGSANTSAAVTPTTSSAAASSSASKSKTSKTPSAPHNSGPKIITTVKNLPAPTVQQGGSCQSGQAGCQGGHFTGNFFGQ